MINSRKLEDLHPHVAKLCQTFIDACAAEGIDVLITSTYRDNESQNALYAQGRTAPGAKVTNAKAGQSWHNWRCAFDFVPVVNGKAQWNDIATFTRCGEIAEGVGLEWAGRWKSFKELAHCQFTGGLTLADFQAGKTLEVLA
ncbi:MAG: M15 family metallopeptidase [Candidatus Paceibacterota bacterium]|jgi:peptidoglycan L-alanyl-D-glutamate endopeptidase CwlK